MLAWLLNLLSRFGRPERFLFVYLDGGKERSIDPAKAHRALWRDQQCDLSQDWPTSANPKRPDGTPIHKMDDVIAAEDRVRDLTRRVFGVKEWREDQEGLTQLETDDLLADFIRYCDYLKKKRKPSPISSQPSTSTEPASSQDSSASPPSTSPDLSSTPSESTDAVLSGQ